MMVPGTDPRLFTCTRNIGSVVNGIVPDGKALMYRGKDEASQYQNMFGVPIPGRILAERVAAVAHMNTVYSSKRPYGSSIIFAAHD